MILTVCFYIILLIVGGILPQKRNRILWVCIITAIYAGIRWDYTPDYPAYEYLFDQFSSPEFEYDSNSVHVEYGWYLINKYLSPIGYYGFVFLCSCIFAYGVYLLMTVYDIPKKYVGIIILGIVTAGGFTTLLSAQRQMLVASIFMISYRFLLYDHIKKWRNLISFRCLIFFLVIWLCTYFHKSAIFLVITPIFFILPAKSVKVPIGIVAVVLVLTVLGNSVLAPLFQSYSSEIGFYDYLNYSETWSGSVTIIQGAMWVFIFYYTMIVYFKCNISKNKQAALLLGITAILVTLSGYYLSQVARIAHYMYVFTYINIGIVYNELSKSGKDTLLFIFTMSVWIIWNALKVFSINVGTFQEYKTILTPLL